MQFILKEEYVKCGKANCNSCPHGPYWYIYYHSDEGKMKKRYYGKQPWDEEAVLADGLNRLIAGFPVEDWVLQEVLQYTPGASFSSVRGLYRRRAKLVEGGHTAEARKARKAFKNAWDQYRNGRR